MKNELKQLSEEIINEMSNFAKEQAKVTELGQKAAAKRSRKASLKLEKLMRLYRKMSVKIVG